MYFEADVGDEVRTRSIAGSAVGTWILHSEVVLASLVLR